LQYFNTFPEHNCALSYLEKFKNSIAVEIGILHSQPFTKSNYHFLIIVKSSIAQQCCFSNMVDDPEVPPEVTATTLVSYLRTSGCTVVLKDPT